MARFTLIYAYFISLFLMSLSVLPAQADTPSSIQDSSGVLVAQESVESSRTQDYSSPSSGPESFMPVIDPTFSVQDTAQSPSCKIATLSLGGNAGPQEPLIFNGVQHEISLIETGQNEAKISLDGVVLKLLLGANEIVPDLENVEVKLVEMGPNNKAQVKVFSGCVQDRYTVNNCPGNIIPPITFNLDCSNITDKKNCRSYINIAACRVYPAYKKITGIALEDRCPVVSYYIFTEDNWPHKEGGEPGGAAVFKECKIDYLPEFSVSPPLSSPPLGPHDLHELLHHFQYGINLSNSGHHSLYLPSMVEAMKLIGDQTRYEWELIGMRAELADFANNPGRVQGKCFVAQTAIEEYFYLLNPESIYKIYQAYIRRLMGGSPSGDGTSSNIEGVANSQRVTNDLNHAFYEVSGNSDWVKQYLISNGCPSF